MIIRRRGILTLPAAGPNVVTPQLVQHYASSVNPNGSGPSGNNYKWTLPNAVGNADCVVLGISYDHGATPTVTDNNGNTWPAAAVSGTSSSNDAAIYVLPGANAGKTRFTVGFGSAITQFQATVTEFCGIATTGAVNGTSSATVAGASLACGSFTPTTNNDANGGNIIWAYYSIGGGASANPTSWVPGGSFTLLDGDIAWAANTAGFPHASMFFLQATQAAINPTITATGDTNTFNCLAVALKVDTAKGTAPPAFRIVREIHFTTTNTGTAAWKLHTPMAGNLGILDTAFNNGFFTVSSLTDSDSGSWTERIGVAGAPYLFSSENRSANANRTATITFNATQTLVTFVFYDVAGAAASPFDGSSAVTSTGGTTSVSDFPDLTPGTNHAGVSFGIMTAISGGPILSVTSPSGAYSDATDYTSKPSTDLMDNGDYYAHNFYSSNALQAWGWTWSGTENNCAAAAAFRSA